MSPPESTERNGHDPGITLLVLLAWSVVGWFLLRRLAAELGRASAD